MFFRRITNNIAPSAVLTLSLCNQLVSAQKEPGQSNIAPDQVAQGVMYGVMALGAILFFCIMLGTLCRRAMEGGFVQLPAGPRV